jgi:deazaflavin-dependent oxidoreductase (nitroreductase family)
MDGTVNDSGDRRPPRWLALANRLNIAMLARGVGPATQRVLTVAGRSTGEPRRTPIAIVTLGEQRYIVAGYPKAAWVKNVRAAGRGTITRGRIVEKVELEELPVDQRAPVLREFLRTIRGGRSFLTIGSGATEQQVAEAAREHPVFRLG